MGFISDIFGGGQADAAEASAAAQVRSGMQAIAATERATEQGLGFLDRFSGVTQRGIDESEFLANPQEQFQFLQNNPLFKLSLDNANRETNARAASKGRLSAGDTLTQLSNNVLQSAQPLIDRQRQDVGNLLNIGTGISTSQANTAINKGSNISNLLTDIGSAQSAGIIGNQNARTQGAGNIISLAGGIGSFFSDSRLKANAEITGVDESGYDVWKWGWNSLANKLFGLKGKAHGVMFSDVIKKNPEAVSYQDGYGKVNYEMIGVAHGS